MTPDLDSPLLLTDPGELEKRRLIFQAARRGDTLSRWTLRRLYRLSWWTVEDGAIVGEVVRDTGH